MEQLPRQRSLVAQSIEILQQRIRDGMLTDRMPSEQQLCEMLQVSRKTVRGALAHLQEDGWIAAGQRGRRRRVLRRARGKRAVASESRTIAFLTPFQESRLPPAQLLNVEILTALLAADGYRLRIVNSKAFGLKRPGSALRALVDGEHADAWVLHHSAKALQRWFEDRKVPAVVLGTTHPDVRLPSVDSDLAASARHAVGMLLRRGHRRISLLLPDPVLAGDLRAEQGARGAVEARHEAGARLSVSRVANDPAAVVRLLARIFASKRPPTAIVSTRAPYILTVVTWLASRGIRIPGDVSVVSLFSNPNFEFVWPPVTRYDINRRSMIGRLYRALMAVSRGEPGPAEAQRIVPDLIPGGSVGPGPEKV